MNRDLISRGDLSHTESSGRSPQTKLDGNMRRGQATPFHLARRPAMSAPYRLSAGVSGRGADSMPDPGEVGPSPTDPTQRLGSEAFLETRVIPNIFNWCR